MLLKIYFIPYCVYISSDPFKFDLQPVKRVTEYPILIEKLLKHTRYKDAEILHDHPDRQNLEDALEISKRLCDQV